MERRSLAGPGERIRASVLKQLDRMGFRPGARTGQATARLASSGHALSQSSRPALDFSFLWFQENDRLAVYRDADIMDAECDLAAAALDAWASTAVSGPVVSPTISGSEASPSAPQIYSLTSSPDGSNLTVTANSPAAQSVVDQVMEDCHLAERSWGLARDLRKYGDKFLEIVVDDSLRVRRVKSLPQGELYRQEDEYGRLSPVAFRQVRNGVDCATFASWQVVHLRNNRQADEMYGRSGLRTARRIWRMLSLLEDSLVNARLMRGYQKLVHFLPVSDGATTQERQQMVQDYIRAMTTTTTINPTTGALEQQNNPANVTTDYYLTVGPGDSPKTGVVSLDPQNQQLQQIPDMEYFQNLLMAGLEVPKAYVGLERDVNSKATLGYQEIHFLRQCGALQRTVNTGVEQVLDLAFTLAGIHPQEVELTFNYGAG